MHLKKDYTFSSSMMVLHQIIQSSNKISLLLLLSHSLSLNLFDICCIFLIGVLLYHIRSRRCYRYDVWTLTGKLLLIYFWKLFRLIFFLNEFSILNKPPIICKDPFLCKYSFLYKNLILEKLWIRIIKWLMN